MKHKPLIKGKQITRNPFVLLARRYLANVEARVKYRCYKRLTAWMMRLSELLGVSWSYRHPWRWKLDGLGDYWHAKIPVTEMRLTLELLKQADNRLTLYSHEQGLVVQAIVNLSSRIASAELEVKEIVDFRLEGERR